MKIYGRLDNYDMDWYAYPVANYVSAWRHFEHITEAKGVGDTVAHIALAISQLVPVLGLISFAIDAGLGAEDAQISAPVGYIAVRQEVKEEESSAAALTRSVYAPDTKGLVLVYNHILQGEDDEAAASLERHQAEIQQIINSPVNFSIVPTNEGNTLLILASYMRLPNTIRKLLQMKATTDIKNNKGYSAQNCYGTDETDITLILGDRLKKSIMVDQRGLYDRTVFQELASMTATVLASPGALGLDYDGK